MSDCKIPVPNTGNFKKKKATLVRYIIEFRYKDKIDHEAWWYDVVGGVGGMVVVWCW